jgi:hypothetical protein
LAVPRSIPMSLDKNPKSFLNIIFCLGVVHGEPACLPDLHQLQPA